MMILITKDKNKGKGINEQMKQEQNKKKRWGGKEGFTLVELICVIAILAVLMAVAVPSYQKIQDQSAEQVAITNAKQEYSLGKARFTLEEAQLDKTPGSDNPNYDPEKDEATWEGEINGKTYKAVYEGKTGKGTVTVQKP